MAIFVSSSFGSSLKGVRDQPRRMAALGFNPWMIRWITFVYAGFWGGVSGLLFVYYNKYIHPDRALHHEFGGSPARRDRRRLGNARWSGRRRRPGTAVEELRLGLYRPLEHAARPGLPVYRSGDADRNRARRQQAYGAAARGDRDDRAGLRVCARSIRPEESIRRPCRHARHLAFDTAGRTPPDHRAQWRRQDHFVQPDQRRHAARMPAR